MRKFIFIIIIFLLAAFAPIIHSVSAAFFQLDPKTVSTKAGETFEIKVNVDAGTAKIKSADAYILYDAEILEPQSVEDGRFFSIVNKDISVSGKAYVSGMIDESTESSATGSGTIATIVFKALSDGVSALEFECTTGSTEGSIIIDENNENIIECSKNISAAVTVGAGTTRPTSVVPTYSPPSTLPKSGIFDNMIKFAVPGAALFFLGVAVRMLL